MFKKCHLHKHCSSNISFCNCKECKIDLKRWKLYELLPTLHLSVWNAFSKNPFFPIPFFTGHSFFYTMPVFLNYTQPCTAEISPLSAIITTKNDRVTATVISSSSYLGLLKMTWSGRQSSCSLQPWSQCTARFTHTLRASQMCAYVSTPYCLKVFEITRRE